MPTPSLHDALPIFVISVEAEGDAQRHQGEGDREAQHDDDDEEAELQDGDFGIGHRASPPVRPRVGSSIGSGTTTSTGSLPRSSTSRLFFCRRSFSSSSTSFGGGGQLPRFMQITHRNTCATPWITSSTPATMITVLNW